MYDKVVMKVDPPSNIITKLLNKNALKPEIGVPSPKNFHTRYVWKKPHGPLPLDFKTVCIYGPN
jgi:hypothetical protein